MALTTIIPNTTLPFLKPQSVSHLSNGISTDINNVQFPLQAGVPVQNIYTFKVIPTASSNTCIAAAQSFGTGAAGGYLTLNSTNTGTAPNILSKAPITFLGQQGVLLDCERGVKITFSTGISTATVMTINGYDYRGVAINYTTPTLNIGNTGVSLSIPMSIVTSVYFSTNPYSGNATPTISVGTTPFIGLPYLLTNVAYVTYASWAGAPLVSSSQIHPGYNWREAEAFGNYSARGFIDLGSTLPNGANILAVTYYVYGSDSELNAEIANYNQSSLKIAGIQHTDASTDANPIWVLPYLVKEDLVGIQVNITSNPLTPTSGGDAPFFIAYQEKLES